MTAPLPFRLTPGRQPLIVLEALVNGSGPLKFLLDTGAGPTLVTPGAAERLRLETRGSEERAHGIGGEVGFRAATLDSIQVGSIRKPDFPVLVTPSLEAISQALGEPIDGDLGHSFFGDTILTIDYAAGTVTFTAPDTGSSPDTSGLPFTLLHESKPLVEIPVWLNGDGPFEFVLDTGASTTAMSPSLAKYAQEVRARVAVTGAGGQSQATAGKVGRIRVGEHEQPDQDAVFLDALAALNQALGKDVKGILGYNFLKHYRVILDYPARRLRLARPD